MTENQPAINKDLLELLVCPQTKAPLYYDSKNNELISESAKLAYPIRGGIPVLIPSEARELRPASSKAGA